MKILVTGGAGFIGSHLVDALILLGHKVIVVDNLSTGRKENINQQAQFYKLDINSGIIEEIFKDDIRMVIHLAAQVSVAKSMKEPAKDAFTNINGSLNLMSLSKKYGVKKFIYINSAAIFGHPQQLPILESHPRVAISNYGISKNVIEDYLLVSGLNFVSLRLANVYGPRQTASAEGGVIASFVNRIINNQALIIEGDGRQTRDFIFVADVVKAILCSLESGDKDCFNIGSGKQTSIIELSQKLYQLVNRKPSLQHQAAREGDIKDSWFCVDKAKRILQWAPETELPSGLLETINYEKINYEKNNGKNRVENRKS